MHDEIKRFHLTGEISDESLVTGRERMIHFLETQMRDSGHALSLDLEPQFTVDYQPEEDKYKFELSIYGIHVGRETAWQAHGVTNGKPLMRSTPQTK